MYIFCQEDFALVQVWRRYFTNTKRISIHKLKYLILLNFKIFKKTFFYEYVLPCTLYYLLFITVSIQFLSTLHNFQYFFNFGYIIILLSLRIFQYFLKFFNVREAVLYRVFVDQYWKNYHIK